MISPLPIASRISLTEMARFNVWSTACRENSNWSLANFACMSASRPMTSCAQAIRVQVRQLRQHEQPVFANELVIEPDFAAPVVGALDADHVPVDLALV